MPGEVLRDSFLLQSSLNESNFICMEHLAVHESSTWFSGRCKDSGTARCSAHTLPTFATSMNSGSKRLFDHHSHQAYLSHWVSLHFAWCFIARLCLINYSIAMRGNSLRAYRICSADQQLNRSL